VRGGKTLFQRDSPAVFSVKKKREERSPYARGRKKKEKGIENDEEKIPPRIQGGGKEKAARWTVLLGEKKSGPRVTTKRG